jgi:hypothetical protein
MDLSEFMYASLLTLVTNPPEPIVWFAPQEGPRWGGKWCCPFDGEPLAEMNGIALCAACGRSLRGHLIYQLIEVHSHERLIDEGGIGVQPDS